jgi:hypothetical protein
MVMPINPALGSYATNNGLSGTYIPEIWSGKLLEKFYEKSIFPMITDTDWGGEINVQGDKLNIRTIPSITVLDYRVGDKLNYERPRSDNQYLYIDHAAAYAFTMSDIEKQQTDINYITAWANDAAENTKQVIDKVILGTVPGSVSPYNTGITAGKVCSNINLGVAYTDGSKAISLSKTSTVEKLTECAQALGENSIPDDNRWAALPMWTCQRIQVSELSEASYKGDGRPSSKTNGYIGIVGNFEIYSTNNILPVMEGSVGCYKILFGHKKAIAFASPLAINEELKNPAEFGMLYRGLQLYGFSVVQPTALGMLYAKMG